MINGWRDSSSREHYRGLVLGLIRSWAFTAFEIRSLAWMEDALEPESDCIRAFEHLWRLLFGRDTPMAMSLLVYTAFQELDNLLSTPPKLNV